MPSELTREVLALRGRRAQVHPALANAVIREEEPPAEGVTVPTATLLLAAAECPLRCAMCDLWQHTLTTPTPPGATVEQIETALAGQPRQGTIKLYNSGSFFDPRSVPVQDYRAIAEAVQGFDRVVVENHPRFGRRRMAAFANLLAARLEIAVGLETVQTSMLRRLNKQMTRDDFDRFAAALQSQSIDLRVFLMLKPPWTGEAEAVAWTLLSVRHAVACGARHITIIPARSGNGWMEQRARAGEFAPPSLRTLAEAVKRSQHAVRQIGARCAVTADLWDVDAAADPEAYRQLCEANRLG